MLDIECVHLVSSKWTISCDSEVAWVFKKQVIGSKLKCVLVGIESKDQMDAVGVMTAPDIDCIASGDEG